MGCGARFNRLAHLPDDAAARLAVLADLLGLESGLLEASARTAGGKRVVAWGASLFKRYAALNGLGSGRVDVETHHTTNKLAKSTTNHSGQSFLVARPPHTPVSSCPQ